MVSDGGVVPHRKTWGLYQKKKLHMRGYTKSVPWPAFEWLLSPKLNLKLSLLRAQKEYGFAVSKPV
jgi:hypothetical protein